MFQNLLRGFLRENPGAKQTNPNPPQLENANVSNNMNNQSPLIPQGSLVEQKNKGRARFKIAVFFVLAVHGIGLLALLMQGCRREPAQQSEQTSNAAPAA